MVISEPYIEQCLRRYDNCVRVASMAEPNSWAQEFWLQTANAVKRNCDSKRTDNLFKVSFSDVYR